MTRILKLMQVYGLSPRNAWPVLTLTDKVLPNSKLINEISKKLNVFRAISITTKGVKLTDWSENILCKSRDKPIELIIQMSNTSRPWFTILPPNYGISSRVRLGNPIQICGVYCKFDHTMLVFFLILSVALQSRVMHALTVKGTFLPALFLLHILQKPKSRKPSLWSTRVCQRRSFSKSSQYILLISPTSALSESPSPVWLFLISLESKSNAPWTTK